MVVAEGHIVPLGWSEVVLIDQRSTVLRGTPLVSQAGQLPVQQKNVDRTPALRPEGRSLRLDDRLVGRRQHRAVQIRERQVTRLIDDDVHSECFVQPEDRACFRRSRGVVFARDHHDGSVRKTGPQPVQLLEEVENRGVGRADGVKDVARE